jgi:hypothetical protein
MHVHCMPCFSVHYAERHLGSAAVQWSCKRINLLIHHEYICRIRGKVRQVINLIVVRKCLSCFKLLRSAYWRGGWTGVRTFMNVNLVVNSHNSYIGIVTRTLVREPGIPSLDSRHRQRICLFHNIHIGSENRPASYTAGTAIPSRG